MLDKTGVNFPSFEVLWAFREKHRRVNLRLWVHLHKFDQYPLRTTPMSDPVCDEGYFWIMYHVSLILAKKLRDSIRKLVGLNKRDIQNTNPQK